MSTTEECRQLRGWDMTHEYDPPPDIIDAVYGRPNSRDQDLDTALADGVYQLQYHPCSRLIQLQQRARDL